MMEGQTQVTLSPTATLASVESTPESTATSRVLLWTAITSAGLGSATLFAIEPFVGKVLLPRLGGAPAVWNTCMMVFQLLLLLGYGYSVLLGRMRDTRLAARMHAGAIVIAALLSPFTMPLLWRDPAPGSSPVGWIVLVVSAAVGLPFMLLAASSPLLQLWLTRRDQPVPNVHRLYAVTNLANLAGLALYVAVLEPLLGARKQSWLLIGAAVLALSLSLRVAAGQRAPLHAQIDADDAVAPGTVRQRAAWTAWSFAASLSLFAVSTYLATDVASVPLLFVLPLAIFLLAFALGYSAWAERRRVFVRALGFAVPLLALLRLLDHHHAVGVADLLLPLAALGVLVTALAQKLAEERPSSPLLPEYYAAMGVGGVIAGVVAVLLIPWGWERILVDAQGSDGGAIVTLLGGTASVFVSSAVPEYPAVLVLGMVLLSRGRLGRMIALSALALTLLSGWRGGERAQALFRARNFYGTVRVQHDRQRGIASLKHGTTLHGFAHMGEASPMPTTYYHRASPIGQLMPRLAPQRALLVGLGAGTMAAYAEKGDVYDFYELNPLVRDVAERREWFGYLSGARERGAEINVYVGDGRLLASQRPERDYDLVVLDAFSSDSIPVHLLTREALSQFIDKTRTGAAIAVHVSNRFFDLVPVVAAAAEELGWWWTVQTRRDTERFEKASCWVILMRDEQRAKELALDRAPWKRPAIDPDTQVWSDDWANPIGSLKVLRSWRGIPARGPAAARASR